MSWCSATGYSRKLVVIGQVGRAQDTDNGIEPWLMTPKVVVVLVSQQREPWREFRAQISEAQISERMGITAGGNG